METINHSQSENSAFPPHQKKACRGEEIVIARGKEPVVKLVPITETRGDRQPGALKGKIHIGPEFFEPLSPEELEGSGVVACVSYWTRMLCFGG
jgi:antitoxin (DNA-binding transcriptional repressor) of toxin-antitoxin stability system